MTLAEKIVSKFSYKELLVQRRFKSFGNEGSIIFSPDLTKEEVIERALLSLQSINKKINSIDLLAKEILFARQVEKVSTVKAAVEAILAGDAVLVVEGFSEIIVIDCKAWASRGISEPPVESVMRGPREGFTEDIKTNLQMIQRRLRTTDLVFERLRIGKNSNTAVAIVYLNSIARKGLVLEVKRKLKKIKIDAIYDSTSLEPFLEEKPNSIFKQIGYSERPDIVCSKINEGRIAVVVDCSPIVLTLPFLLIEDFHSPEDYYQKPATASFVRMLRLTALVIGLLLPGIFVSILQFNFDILPLGFLMSVMNSIKGTPFPPLLEVLVIILFFEILREAALRMPKMIGFGLAVVGGIILGEAAILSGLFSPSSVLIVALSTISMFTVPNALGSSMILRLVFTLLGGILGLFGMLLFAMLILCYLCSFGGYGTSYMAPFSPFIAEDLKDSLIKKPLFDMKKRPSSIFTTNKTRMRD